MTRGTESIPSFLIDEPCKALVQIAFDVAGAVRLDRDTRENFPPSSSISSPARQHVLGSDDARRREAEFSASSDPRPPALTGHSRRRARVRGFSASARAVLPAAFGPGEALVECEGEEKPAVRARIMRASFFQGRVVGKEKRGRAESTDEWDARVAEVDALRDSSLGCLPRSIFADVVSRLDGPDVARLGMTCRAARAYCSRPAIWRALARAQEPPALVREDLVNRDFSWKQLYAWRRHVLWHRARGVNRIAVADAARVLTCDPIEGGGRVRVAYEAPSPQPLAPNLLAWSPDASMLVVAQESAEGCRLVLSAPTACVRPKSRGLRYFGGDRRRIVGDGRRAVEPKFDGYGSEDATMGDEDSTAAAGHGLGTASRTRARCVYGTNGTKNARGVFGGGDSGGGWADAPDDEDDSVDANKAKEPRVCPRGIGIVAPRRVRSHKLPAMNSVHLPLQNPVFAAFTACGTRLLLMNVRRHSEEFALHELDLTVAMGSLYGATPGAVCANGSNAAKNHRAAAGTKRRRGTFERGTFEAEHSNDVRGVGPDGWLSADARETLTLVESGRELSFSPGPRTRDVLSLVNGAGVGKISPANLRAWSGLDECTTHPVAGGRLGCARLDRALEFSNLDEKGLDEKGLDETVPSEGSFELDGDELEEERDRDAPRKTHPAWRAGAGGASTGAVGGGVADPAQLAAAAAAASDDDEGDTYEVSSAPESLWWRRGVDAFRGGYSAGVETLRSAAARLARSLLPGRAIGGDPTRGRRRRGGSVWGGGRGEREEAARRRAAEVERRSRSGGRTIKRARLTGRPVAGAVGGGGGDRWAPLVGGFSRLGKAKKGSVPSLRSGYVNPFASVIPSVRRARPSDVVSFRRDRLHETSLPGLAHIVQWVRPARRVRSVRGSNPVGDSGKEKDEDKDEANFDGSGPGDGHWLVPVSFPDAMPRAVHLALLPAIPTPGPDEIRGSAKHRRESARLALLGLSDPSARSVGARIERAVERSAQIARSLFSKDHHPGLEDACVVELSPPAAYNELHVVVSTVAAAAPGGKIVCWADDGALWARRIRVDSGHPDPKNVLGVPGEGSGNRTWDRATRVLDLRRCGFGADAGLRIDDEGSVAPNPVLHQVCAMQWSASGTRLLVLMACHFTTTSHVFPMHQWMVWDPPATWLESRTENLSRLEDPCASCSASEDPIRRRARSFEVYEESLAGDFCCSHGRDRYRCEECGGGGLGEDPETIASRLDSQVEANGGGAKVDPGRVLGVITRGRWHVPTKTFVQDVLPIFEQYSQTHSLWNPDEDRVCYPVRGDGTQPAAGVGGDHVAVARFPRMPIVHRLASAGGGAGANVRQVGEHNALPFKHAFADSAVVVCEGSFCVWSPC